MYYIGDVDTWIPSNHKCIEMREFIREFRQTLIPDEAAVDALVKEIQKKVDELNDIFPRTYPLKLTREDGLVSCTTNHDKDYVFAFRIEKVRRTYTTLETMLDEKENETKAEEKDCGC